MGGIRIIGIVIAAAIAAFVWQDANKRGMSGPLWGIGTFLLCIVFLPLYLIMRKPLITAGVMPLPPGTPVYMPPGQYQPQPPGQYPPPPPQISAPPAGNAPPPSAGPVHFCTQCGQKYEGTVKFCPNCGAAV